MKLSQDILFFRLLMKYPVYFLNRNTEFTEFEYPVIHEDRLDAHGHVVVIFPDELEKRLLQHDCKDILYISVGEMSATSRLSESSIIVVEKNVSLIRVANDLYEIFSEFEKWHDSMKTVLYESGGFQELVNCCDSIIIEPMAIVDREFQIIAYSEMSDELGYNASVEEDKRMSLAAFNNFIRQVDYDCICKNLEIFIMSDTDGKALRKNLFYNNENVGSIGIKLSTGEDYIQAFNTAVLEHFHSFAEKLYAKYSSFDDRENSKSNLVSILQDSINKKKLSEKQWEDIYKENKWDIKDHFLLIQFMVNPHQTKTLYAKYLSSKIDRKWQESICFIYMDHLLLLTDISKLNNTANINFFKSLSVFLRENTLIAGVSRAFKSIANLQAAYEQTETAVKIGVMKDPELQYYLFDSYVLDYMLQNSKGIFEKEEICSDKLMTLIQHDKEKGTLYHKTLLTYFDCKYNAAEAAKRLFINRSTFHYRLDRIQELVKIDFESIDELLYLSISFRILLSKEL